MHVLPLIAVIALVVAGCGGTEDSFGTTPKSEKPATSAETMEKEPDGSISRQDADGMVEDKGAAQKPLTKPRSVVVNARSSEFGSILFDGDGQVFYLFDADKGSTSTCYGACAEAWPPVLVDGEPRAGSGAQAELLGTTRRRDGSTQLTYGGKPMYYYAHEKPGEVKCHNINVNGGLWLVVKPDGTSAPA